MFSMQAKLRLGNIYFKQFKECILFYTKYFATHFAIMILCTFEQLIFYLLVICTYTFHLQNNAWEYYFLCLMQLFHNCDHPFRGCKEHLIYRNKKCMLCMLQLYSKIKWQEHSHCYLLSQFDRRIFISH